MPTRPVDDELDPLEHQDIEDQEEDHAKTEEPAPEEGHVHSDPDADIEDAIKKVAVEEEEPTKQKPHMIPRDLIDRELTPEDLWDEGSI